MESCGSGLARDGVVTCNIDGDCPCAIAGKPAPTGFCVQSENLFKSDLHLYGKRYSGTISLHPPLIAAVQGFDPPRLFSSPPAVAISLQP
jgi:hypothetical protein